MFDALWTLRLHWRLWLGTTGGLLLLTVGPLWWQRPAPTYQATTTLVAPDGKGKGVLLGRLNSVALARHAGLHGGESVRAGAVPESDLLQVTGTALTPGRAMAVTNGLVGTLEQQLQAEATQRAADAELGVTLTRQRLTRDLAQVTAALRQLPPPNGLAVPAGGTVVVVGPRPSDVVRVALESRYLELTKSVAALPALQPGASRPALTVLDPAMAATVLPPPIAPLRAALVASLVCGVLVPWIRAWWAWERAQRAADPERRVA